MVIENFSFYSIPKYYKILNHSVKYININQIYLIRT